MFDKKRTGTLNNPSRSEAYDREEVQTEWELSIRRAIQDPKMLKRFVNGNFDVSPSSYDRRWHGACPWYPFFAIVNGAAGIYEHRPSQPRTLLLPLPELGTKETLARNIAQHWQPTWSRFTLQERLRTLEFSVPDLEQTTRIVDDSYDISVILRYTGTLSRNDTAVSEPHILLAEETIPIPDNTSDHNAIANENLPDIDRACALWAKRYLDTGTAEFASEHHIAPDHIFSGILTTKHWITPTYEVESNDTRSTRIEGGDPVVDILIDGKQLMTIARASWPAIKEYFHAAPEGPCVLTFRELLAMRTIVFTSPRGKAALRAEAQSTAERLAESLFHARADAEAKVKLRDIHRANAAEVERHRVAVEREGSMETYRVLFAEAFQVRRAPFFRCMDPSLQQRIRAIADGKGPDWWHSRFDADSADKTALDSWNSWATAILSDVRIAQPEAEIFAAEEARGETLHNFSPGNPDDSKHVRGWVITADGTLCKGSTPTFWPLVNRDELALAWRKNTAAAPHVFTVAKLPVDGVTPAQRTAVHALLTALSQEWDGVTGLSGRTTSPPIGRGWDLSSTAPRQTYVPYTFVHSSQNIVPSYSAAVDTLPAQDPLTLHLLPIPSLEELTSAIDAQHIAEREHQRTAKQRALDIEAERARAHAAFTPEVCAIFRERFEELDAYAAICTTLPQKSADAQKFVREIQNNGCDAHGPRYHLDHRTMSTSALNADIDWRINTIKTFATRKKINDEYPKLWDKICNRVEQWRSIPALVDAEILKGGDVALLMDETVDGVSLTTSLMAKRVARRFLENPWGMSVADAIVAETKELFTLLS